MAWKPDYATSTELKNFVRISDSVDDAQVAMALTTASRAVDRTTGRQFGQLAAAAEWSYTAEWDRRRLQWVVSIDDLQDVTDMLVYINGVATTEYVLEEPDAVDKGKAYTGLVFNRGVSASAVKGLITINAKWGWNAVPVPVKMATLLQGSRILARRDSPYGVVGSPAQGSELRLLAKVDPDVEVALADYKRIWVCA